MANTYPACPAPTVGVCFARRLSCLSWSWLMLHRGTPPGETLWGAAPGRPVGSVRQGEYSTVPGGLQGDPGHSRSLREERFPSISSGNGPVWLRLHVGLPGAARPGHLRARQNGRGGTTRATGSWNRRRLLRVVSPGAARPGHLRARQAGEELLVNGQHLPRLSRPYHSPGATRPGYLRARPQLARPKW